MILEGSGTVATAVLASITTKSVPGTRLVPVLGPNRTETVGSKVRIDPSARVTLVALRVPRKSAEVNEEFPANWRNESGFPDWSRRGPGPIFPIEIGERGADEPCSVSVALLMLKNVKILKSGGRANPPCAGLPV